MFMGNEVENNNNDLSVCSSVIETPEQRTVIDESREMVRTNVTEQINKQVIKYTIGIYRLSMRAKY